MLSTGRVMRCVLIATMAVSTTGSGVALALAQNDLAVIILKDGTEVSGKIIEETDDAISLETDLGPTRIKRSRIKEIRRGAGSFRDEFKRRFDAAASKGKVAPLLEVAEWARDKGLVAESRKAYLKIISIEPDHEKARTALGHGLFEGKWVDEKRVAELTGKGYKLDGVKLVKDKDSPNTATVVKRRPKKELTAKERKALERKAAKRKKDLKKFQERRRREVAGVDWRKAWVIPTRNYVVTCNSTKDVARAYGGIMEEIHRALRKWIKMPFKRRQRPAVFVYKTQEEFMERTPYGRNTGGFYDPRTEQVHAYHGGFGTTGSTLKVLAHEATHQFQGKVLGGPGMYNFPKWVIEGMAVYLGDGSRLDYKKKKLVTNLIPRDRLYHIQRKMKENTHTPLKKLCTLPGRRFTGSHYADAWSLLYYLFEGPKKKIGQKFFVDYWTLGTKRKLKKSDFTSKVNSYFGSVEKLEKDWIEFVLSLDPEPAGTMKGDTFVSEQFMFEVRLPWEKWEWSTKAPNSSVLIGMQIPETQVRATVRFFNNNDNLSAEEFFDKYLKKFELRKCTDFKVSKARVADTASIKVTYVDKSYGDEDDDEKDGKEKPVDEIRKQYVSYLAVSLNNVYVITGEAPKREFAKWAPDFQDVADSFELILKIRW